MDFQSDLFGGAVATSPGVRPLDGASHGVQRTTLTRGAWVDVLRNFVVGADDVLARLVADVPWRAERRPMYDRIVDVPRLIHTYVVDEELPHPLLTTAREALSAHYKPELSLPEPKSKDPREDPQWMELWKKRHEKWAKTTIAKHSVEGPQISYEDIATPVLEPEPRWYA